MNRKLCKCGKQLVAPSGPQKSDILLVGEFPGKEEIIRGMPFVGQTGDILRAELIRAGMPITACRMTNLWLHAKDEKGCDIKRHMNEMAREMENRKFVLLMGSDLTKILWDCGVMELSGLEVKHKLFPKTRLFISPNPAIALHGPIGELRLAVERFVNATR